MEELNINVKTDLCNLMKCKNCKHFKKDCSRVLAFGEGKPEDTCIEWEQRTEPLEDSQMIHNKQIIHFMYNEIISVLKDYLVMEEHQYKLLALWLIGTYAHEEFNTYPLVFFNAMRGSGKTRLLKLVSAIGCGGDGSVQNNLTEAVLFRIPRGKTTCIDEVEQIGTKEKSTLRELLNAAYKKGMKVCRMKKTKKKNADTGQLEETQVAEEFEPYFPIALANINGLDDVLEDRAITLILEKSNDGNRTKKIEDFDKNLKIQWIKQTLMKFSVVMYRVYIKKYLENWNFWLNSTHNYTNYTNYKLYTNYTNYITNPVITEYLSATNQEFEEIDTDTKDFYERVDAAGIVGRNFELFSPLLILAKIIDNSLFEEIFEVIKTFVHEKKSTEYAESRDVSLFEFVYNKENILGREFISIKELTREFRLFINADLEEDKHINEKWMGKALKRLNLILDKKRVSHGMEVTFNYMKAQEKLKIFKF